MLDERLLDGRSALGEPERLRDRRREERRVSHGGKVDEDDAVAHPGRELGRRRQSQARLACAARPRERHEPDLVALQERADRGDLEPPSDERRRRDGQLQRRSRRGRLGRRERRVVAQDPALELSQLRRGIDAELLHEQLAGGAAGGERVGLAAGAIQRERVLDAEPLPVGLGRDQALSSGTSASWRPSASSASCRSSIARRRRSSSCPAAVSCDRLSGEVGERGANPEFECAAQILGGVGRSSGGERVAAAFDEPLEAREVELVGIET